MLASFLFYFVMLVVTFVAIFHIFEFFQLLSDIIRNGIGLNTILQYHFFLTPRLIYDFTPIGVLASVLVVFAILSKHNEITAFKACGISAHRLTVPILVACLGLSAGLFAFDYFWVPDADRRQDQLRSIIKGKPPQTYLHPDRKWINTEHNRIYYYEYFDPAARVMSGVNIYEIDPGPFRLKRHIFAKRARWEPTLNKWEFQSGWCADIQGTRTVGYDSFTGRHPHFQGARRGARLFHARGASIAADEFPGARRPTSPTCSKKASIPSLFRFSSTRNSRCRCSPSSWPWYRSRLRSWRAIEARWRASASASRSPSLIGRSTNYLSRWARWASCRPQMAAWSPDVLFSLAGLYFLVRMRT